MAPASATARREDVTSAAACSGNRFAEPKSSTLARLSGVITTLSDFRSRWMMPRSCACANASEICPPYQHDRLERQAVNWNHRRQRRALDKLHGDVAHAIGFVDFLYTWQMWEWLSAEALRASSMSPGPRRRIGERARRQQLQRDITSQLCVVGAHYLAHPTGAEFLDDPVVAEGLFNHEP